MTISNLDKPQIVAHLSKSLNYTAFDVKWIPCSAKCVVVGQNPRGTGVIQVIEIKGSQLEVVKEVISYSRLNEVRKTFWLKVRDVWSVVLTTKAICYR
jgi:hypothetical protein